MEKTVLAIDPGTSKCGMALVRRNEGETLDLLWHGVVPTTHILAKIHEAYAVAPFGMIIVGGGTHSSQIVTSVREHVPSLGILEIDERDTTLQARERYWEHNRRTGWRKLLPATLQTPPVPVDDYVALILAERVLLSV